MSITVADLFWSEQDQVRINGVDPAHVRELAEALAEVPFDQWPKPLVTCWHRDHPDEGYAILGGHHTIAVAQQQGIGALLCRVIPDGDWEDAFEDNRLHGLGPSPEDKKRHARRLAARYPEMGYREIGRRTGLSDKTAKRAIEGAEEAVFKQRAASDPIERWFHSTNRLDSPPTPRKVKDDIDSYAVEDRADVAKLYTAIGRALVQAAAPYLEGG